VIAVEPPPGIAVVTALLVVAPDLVEQFLQPGASRAGAGSRSGSVARVLASAAADAAAGASRVSVVISRCLATKGHCLGSLLSDHLGRTAVKTWPLPIFHLAAGAKSTPPIIHMFGALAEFERSLIRERTQAGLATARRAGREHTQHIEERLARCRAVSTGCSVAFKATPLALSSARYFGACAGCGL
jgi:hypothetical protein